MGFMIFSGDDYYPGGGWEDHDRTCETMEEARLAIMKLRGDWLHIVDVSSGEKTEFRWGNNQWHEDNADYRAELAAGTERARAKFAQTHVKVPDDKPWCGACTIGYTGSYCSCGKYANPPS